MKKLLLLSTLVLASFGLKASEAWKGAIQRDTKGERRFKNIDLSSQVVKWILSNYPDSKFKNMIGREGFGMIFYSSRTEEDVFYFVLRGDFLPFKVFVEKNPETGAYVVIGVDEWAT